MTEPVFEIISRKRTHVHKPTPETPNSYNSLFQNYVSLSYGYYSELFIKKICMKVQNQKQKLRTFPLRKVLRQTIQKYMMTDLEIIYLQYFAELHQWNYLHPLIQQSIISNQTSNQHNQTNCLKLFLHLICFFVKSYVGSKQELLALVDFHNQNLPGFPEIYQLWAANSPQKMFHLSPRDLNQIYSQYARSYLSTTYSIIPSKDKELKQKKSSSKASKQLIPVFEKKSSLRNFDSNLWQHQNSLRMDFSDLRTLKKQSLVIGSSILNESNEKVEQMKRPQSNGPKKISLNKKRKVEKDEVNNVAKSFFRGKDLGLSVQDMRKSENSIKEMMPNSFLDINNHSSRIESLPLPYRNNSNLFNFSQLF